MFKRRIAAPDSSGQARVPVQTPFSRRLFGVVFVAAVGLFAAQKIGHVSSPSPVPATPATPPSRLASLSEPAPFDVAQVERAARQNYIFSHPQAHKVAAPGSYAEVAHLVDESDWQTLSPNHRSMIRRMMLDAQRGIVGVMPCFAPGTDLKTVRAFETASVNLGFFRSAPYWRNTASGPHTQGAPMILRWSVVPDGTALPTGAGEPAAGSDLKARLNAIYGDEETWRALFRQMFARYEQVSGIRYVEETKDDGVEMSPNTPGQIDVRGDVRIGGHGIDGDGGILAYDFYPDISDMVIDTKDDFFAGTEGNSLGFRNVIAHEHGHGLGFQHVCPVDQTKLMEPFVSGRFDGPQLDDIQNTQRGYGDTFEPNNSVTTSTELGTLDNGTVSKTPVSLDKDSDVDFYRFGLSAVKEVTVTIHPLGGSYLEGPQNMDGSCTAGTPFAAGSRRDLTLALLDSTGKTIAQANATQAGGDETIPTTSLTSAQGPFSVRVSGDSTDAIQLYSLSLTVTNPTQRLAIDDNYSVNEDASLSVPAKGVLSNDSEPGGKAITAIQVTAPKRASKFTLRPDGSFTYTPAANFSGTDAFTYKFTNGSDESNRAKVSITVQGINDAPVLSTQSGLQLAPINEDLSVKFNVGTSIGGLLASIKPSRISDADPDSPQGIALVEVDNSHGAWEFSTDRAQTWTSVGAVSEKAARLLASNSNTRLRFLPAANYFGVTTSAIQFRAWDQSSGGNGLVSSTSSNGGTTAFSVAIASASQTVNPIADAPIISGTSTEQNTQSTTGLVIQRNPVDGAEVTAFKISGIKDGALFQANGTSSIKNGDFISLAQGAAGLKFTPANGFSGRTIFVVQAAIGRNGSGLSAPTSAQVAVNLPVPVGTVADINIVEGNSGSKTAVFTMTFNRPIAAGSSFTFSTSNNTAIAGQDYTAISNNLTLRSTSSFTFGVRISGDTQVETDESFFVDFSNVRGFKVSGVRARCTIQNDDDLAPTAGKPVARAVTFSVVSGASGEANLSATGGTGTVGFRVATKPLHGTATILVRGTTSALQYTSRRGFVGTDTIGIQAYDSSGDGPVVQWTVRVVANLSPELVSLSPSSGTFAPNLETPFELSVQDPNGGENLSAVFFTISNSAYRPDTFRGVGFWFDPATNTFCLRSDDGRSFSEFVPLGSTLENSQVKITLNKGDVSRTNDGTLSIRPRLTFKPSWTGTKTLWARVEDKSGSFDGFRAFGQIVLPVMRATGSGGNS